MADRDCVVEDCDRARRSREWCNRHYQRWVRTGDPLKAGGERYLDPEEAFLARTEPLAWTGCLIWTGSRNSQGYGAIKVGGKSIKAHRYAWEREHGPVPKGEVIDHRYHCDKACVEESHLRRASRAQNAWNRSGGSHGSRTGVRNVYLTATGRYQVIVTKDGQWHGRSHDTLEEARQEAIELRTKLFGEFAGRG